MLAARQKRTVWQFFDMDVVGSDTDLIPTSHVGKPLVQCVNAPLLCLIALLLVSTRLSGLVFTPVSPGTPHAQMPSMCWFLFKKLHVFNVCLLKLT